MMCTRMARFVPKVFISQIFFDLVLQKSILA